MTASFLAIILTLFLVGCNSGGENAGGGVVDLNQDVPENNFTPPSEGAYIQNITASPAKINSSISKFVFEVSYNKKVSVTGCIPTIWTKIGGNLHLAYYVSGSGSQLHNYEVNFPDGAFDDNGPDIISPMRAAKNCLLETAIENRTQVHLEFKNKNLNNVLIDQIGSKLTSFEITPSSGILTVGDEISIKAFYEDVIYADSNSTLPFKVGNGNRSASYESGNGSKEITFSYKIKNADLNQTIFTFGQVSQFTLDEDKNNATGPSSIKTANFIITAIDSPPVANSFSPNSFNEDTQSVITLSYSDFDQHPATSCTLSSLSKITITQDCACVNGVCTVGVTGDANYYGPGSFNFKVTANGLQSNLGSSSLMITGVDDLPVTENLTYSNLIEDTQKTINLTYTDVESHPATGCSLSNLTSVSIVSPCSCNAQGCSVVVKGTPNYNGPASFNYTVVTNGKTSNSSNVDLTISPVNDAPEAFPVFPAALDEDNSTIVQLFYLDQESDVATTCDITNPTNLSVTSSCQCILGICSVEVTGDENYFGNANFEYTVTAGGIVSNTSNATVSFNPVDDAPQSIEITPDPINEDEPTSITLSYTDIENDEATSCEITDLNQLTISTPCTCTNGVCSVEVLGVNNYSGAASFNYTVSSNSLTSNSSAANITISSVDDAPIAENITPPDFNEDTESVITLSYTDVENDQATSCDIQNLVNATVSTPCSCSDGICTVGITGSENYSGSASFDYTISANDNTSVPATATLNILPMDDGAVAENITPNAFNEDTESIITLVYNDPDSDQASSCEVSNLTNITESTPCSCSNGVCTVGVTGTSNYFGSASFDYSVTTLGIQSNIAQSTLNILPIDDAPETQDQTPNAMSEDTSGVINLSYSDVESDQAVSCEISNLTQLSLVQNCSCTSGVCSVEIIGSENYNGPASFTYTITANGQTSNSSIVNLTINPSDDPPVANDFSASNFNEDEESIITLTYSDPESDLAVTCSVSDLNQVTETTPCSCQDGVCTVGIKGTSNYNGAGSFKYGVTTNSLSSNLGLVNFEIDPVDDAPSVSALTPSSFDEDASQVLTFTYSDPENDNASDCSVSDESHLTILTPCACTSGECTLTVKGELNYNGQASLKATLTTNSLVSELTTFNFTLNPVDDAPTTIDAAISDLSEDAESIITLNYNDVDNDQALTCSVSSLVNVSESTPCSCTQGVCTVGITGSLNYFGAGEFEFKVTTNGVDSNLSKINFNIISIDDAPIANNLTPSAIDEDTELQLTLDYSDVEGDQANSCNLTQLTNLTITENCSCSAGVCTVKVQGTQDYFGNASFKYTVSANGQVSNSADVSFSINPIDDAPVSININPVAFNEDTSSLITLSYSDVENDQATTCEISNLDQILISQDCACSDGICQVEVVGPENYSGASSFNFKVISNGLSSNLSLATLTISPVDDAPIADDITPDPFNEDTSSIITLSYSDTEGDQAISCSLTDLTNITVTSPCVCVLGICSVGVKGDSNFNGMASFNYSVIAGIQSSNSALATLNISAVDDAPETNAINSDPVDEDTETTITLAYTDPENDEATTCSTNALNHILVTEACSCTAGVCSVKVKGTLNYNGQGSFNYQVSSNGLNSNSSTVTIDLLPVDDAPVAQNLNPAAFNEDTESIITLSYSDVENDEATQCALSSLTNVSLSTPCSCSSGICTVGVTGNLDYSGAASFDFIVSSNGLISNSATATLSILPIDDAPVAQDITPGAFNEDSAQLITLSYSDTENNQADSCTVSNLNQITVVSACSCVSGVCKVSVQGLENYYGSASFSYSVTALGQTSNIATATLSINSVDDAPVANNLTPDPLIEDTLTEITLSYTDVENHSATICSISAFTNISIVNSCTCSAGICKVGIKGTNNYSGPGNFTYSVTANGLTSNLASVDLTITPEDDAPIAQNINPTAFNEDTATTISLQFTDAEGDVGSSCQLSTLTNVTVTQACTCDQSGCVVEVKGNTNYFGSASFNYTVTANGKTSNIALASLSILPVDDAPVAADLTPTAFNEDTESTIALSYTDAENDQGSSCELTNLSNITITSPCACSNGSCIVKVKGTSQYFGAASFNYTITANNNISNIALATLTINSVDDPPQTQNISPVNFDEDTESIINLGYTDTENDQASSCQLTNLNNIFVSTACQCVSGSCSVGVKGVLNYNGSGSFQYSVTANTSTSNVSTASFSINSIEDAPVALNMNPSAILEDQESVLTLNYTDGENDLATTCSVSELVNVTESTACSCSSGICSVGVKGTLNFSGAASFKFKVNANTLDSNLGLVSFNITPQDDPPVSENLANQNVNEDTQIVVQLVYTDPENHQAGSCTISNLNQLSITQACTCNSGVCSVGVTGSSNYFGAAGFNYTVTANGQTSNLSSSTITILSVDDAPVASNLTPPAFDEDTSSTITLSYNDVESDLAVSCTTSNLANVSIVTPCACSSGSCSVTVAGDPNFSGSASFQYNVTANGKTSNSATANLTISSINDAPVAENLTPSSFNEDTSSVITLVYTDQENDSAAVCSVSNLLNVSAQSCSCSAGICSVEVSGTSNYFGPASFSYTVTAGGQVSNSANASFTIDPVDDAPVAADISPTAFNEDTEAIISLSYSDLESDQATTCTISNPTNISVVETCACSAGVCSVKVTGTLDYSGAASFNYTVTANSKSSNSATASLTISGINDAPVANNLTPSSVDEDTETTINLVYTDTENDQASTCSLSNLNQLQETSPCSCSSGSCSVKVKGVVNFNGAASFNYTVSAAGQNSNSASVNFSINPVDDAPVANNINPPSFNEDTSSIITLSYSDIESNQATTCQVSNLLDITITQACSCSSGVCTVGVQGTLDYSGFASFDYKVTAGLDSNTATASLTINPVEDQPSIANSSIVGSGPVIANGSATSSITITIKDGSNTGLSGITPTFSATDTGGSNSYSACSVTNASGVSTCTLKSTKAEIKTLSLTSPIAKTGGTVTFVPGAVSATTSTITGTGPVVADGSTTSNITIGLYDAFNNPIPGQTPTFKATNTGTTNYYSTCSSTNASGLSSCTMTSTKAEIKTLTILTPVNKNGGTVTFTAGSPVASNSDITGTSPVSSDGISVSFVTISLADIYGNPVEGLIPIFNATDTNSTNVYGACSATDVNGSSSCSLASTKAEIKTLQLTSPVAVTGSTVTFSALLPVSGNSTITATGPVLADGAATSTVTITLRDSNNNGVSGLTPLFDATNTNNGNSYDDCSLSDASGVSVCTFTSTVAEVKAMRITNPVLKTGGNVTFTAGSPSVANSIISGTGPVVANGTDSSNINITLKDAFNNLVSGVTPTFSASGSNNTISSCSATNLSGISTCTLRSTKAENKTLQIQTPIVKSGGSVSFVAGPAVIANSSITGTGPVTPNGIETSTVTITLKDINLNNVSNVTPTYSVSGSNNILGDCSPSNSSGVSTCTFASTTAEIKTLSIATPIIKSGGTVEFKYGAPLAANCSITGSSSIVADGVATSIITITIKDAGNNTIPGITPVFSASGSANTQGACSETDSSGISTCTLASTKAEVKNLQITDPVVHTGDSVTFIPGDPSSVGSTIEGTGPVLANGVEESSVSIYIKDEFGNPIAGQVPTFEMSGTLNTVSTCTTTDNTGFSSCTASSTKAEEKTFKILTPVIKTGNTVDFNPNGINLQVPIELLDYGLASLTAATTYEKTRTSLNTNDYVAQSNRYYFEIVAANTSTTTPATVNLVNGAGTILADTAISVPQNTTAMKRFRLEWTPTTGSDTYRIRTPATATTSSLRVHSAKIIVEQVAAVATKLYFPLTGFTVTSESGSTTTQVTSTTSTAFVQPTNSLFYHWKRNDALYDAIPTNANSWTLETVSSISNAAGTATISLFNKTTNQQIIPATTTVTGSTAISLRQTSFASNATNFTDQNLVEARIKSSSTTYTNRLFKAGLWLKLKFLKRAEIYNRVTTRRVSTTSAAVPDFRFLWEQSAWSNPVVYFESIGNVNTTSVSLIDINLSDNATTGGTTVAGSTLTQPATYGILRSGVLTLTDQDRYYVQHTRTSGTPNLGGAFIVIQVSE